MKTSPMYIPLSAVLDALFDSGEEEVRRICLVYQGSKPQHARVEIQGVPTEGVVDTGADITIIGGDLFKRVAAVARLKKRDLKEPDRVPKTYDQRPFALDGRMELDISFGDTTVRTPVYIKMDSPTRECAASWGSSCITPMFSQLGRRVCRPLQENGP